MIRRPTDLFGPLMGVKGLIEGIAKEAGTDVPVTHWLALRCVAHDIQKIMDDIKDSIEEKETVQS